MDSGPEVIVLAGFDEAAPELLERFGEFAPEWQEEAPVDWVEETHKAWPPRQVGARIFLAPPWSEEPTPAGRVRVIHNPGMASGTGEHPCTQLALMAIENTVWPGCTVADIGTGSGILAIAAKKLGAARVIALDSDEQPLPTAHENFDLNHTTGLLACGSADCIAPAACDVVVANISETVLLAIMDELLRILKPGGKLILTGFPEWQLAAFQSVLENASVTALNDWRCVVSSS